MIPARLEHELNAPSSMLSNVVGIFIVSNAVHLKKDKEPMHVTVSASVTVLSCSSSENAILPILVMPASTTTSLIDPELSNQGAGSDCV